MQRSKRYLVLITPERNTRHLLSPTTVVVTPTDNHIRNKSITINAYLDIARHVSNKHAPFATKNLLRPAPRQTFPNRPPEIHLSCVSSLINCRGWCATAQINTQFCPRQEVGRSASSIASPTPWPQNKQENRYTHRRHNTTPPSPLSCLVLAWCSSYKKKQNSVILPLSFQGGIATNKGGGASARPAEPGANHTSPKSFD